MGFRRAVCASDQLAQAALWQGSAWRRWAHEPQPTEGPYTDPLAERKQEVAEELDLLLNRIGLRVLRRRQELGLSQRELAERLGIQRPNVGRIERGEQNLTLGTLCKLAAELGTTVEELIVAEPKSVPAKR